jgi:dihydrodipicolinate synthase/N-acetylneuraminate lyase
LQQHDWAGVFPAITTPFKPDLTIDYQALESQLENFIQSGCQGIVALGSLGEAPVLETQEKLEILTQAARILHGRVPLVAGISAMSTAEAVSLAKAADDAGVDGLMVLPPYVYRSDWRETEAHVSAVFRATPLSAMLYNNPVAYGTDITPEQIVQLRREHKNFHAVKESSGSLRRITQLKHLAGDSAWMMWWWKVSRRAPSVGLLVWSMPFPTKPYASFVSHSEAHPANWIRSTHGSCPCCGWTQCPSSSR